jgi:enamine deaminase RidA (YjgF/YER057c/UK114 family)
VEKKRIQPQGMFDSPAYSQGIEVSGVSSTVYIGGQNSVDKDGNIVGKGDFALQCRQALTNVKTVLEAADCTVDNLVKLTIYYVKGNDPRLGFAAFKEVFGLMSIPPVITVIEVLGLAVPDFLIEVDAVAVK